MLSRYPSRSEKELIKAFTQLGGEKEVTSFLRDLLTPAEIEEFSNRFQIAKLLWTTNASYVEIADRVKTSTTTVTRVAQWLFKESWQGYAVVLERMFGRAKR
jgi:TrpR-related protein YerC/YecD